MDGPPFPRLDAVRSRNVHGTARPGRRRRRAARGGPRVRGRRLRRRGAPLRARRRGRRSLRGGLVRARQRALAAWRSGRCDRGVPARRRRGPGACTRLAESLDGAIGRVALGRSRRGGRQGGGHRSVAREGVEQPRRRALRARGSAGRRDGASAGASRSIRVSPWRGPISGGCSPTRGAPTSRDRRTRRRWRSARPASEVRSGLARVLVSLGDAPRAEALLEGAVKAEPLRCRRMARARRSSSNPRGPRGGARGVRGRLRGVRGDARRRARADRPTAAPRRPRAGVGGARVGGPRRVLAHGRPPARGIRRRVLVRWRRRSVAGAARRAVPRRRACARRGSRGCGVDPRRAACRASSSAALAPKAPSSVAGGVP